MVRISVLTGITLVLGATELAAQQNPPAQIEPEETLEEIVVTARRGPPRPRPEAVEYYRRYCFDANRLTGKSAPPVDDSDWEPLDDSTRLKFGIADASIPAFSLVDSTRGNTILLKFETFPGPGGLTENRCTMVVLGGQNQKSLIKQLSSLFRGPGTQRQVGHRDGSERIKGWSQWLWTGMPGRGSRSWRTINAETRGTPSGTWVVVLDPSFYNDHDYILGDIKVKQGEGKPISVLSFAYTTRVKQQKRK